MMRKLLMIMVLCTAIGGVQAQNNNKELRDSLAVLNQLIGENPRSTDYRLKKAAINIQLAQWNYAIDEYNHVLSIQPENLAALYYRAYALVNIREYGLAKADYIRFLKLSPIHFEARLGLAVVNEKLGRWKNAMDDYNMLVEMFPDSAQAYAGRAAFERTQKMYDPSLYDWDQAMRLDPLNADYAASKADLQIFLNEKIAARETLDAAVRRGIPHAALRKWYHKSK